MNKTGIVLSSLLALTATTASAFVDVVPLQGDVNGLQDWEGVALLGEGTSIFNSQAGPISISASGLQHDGIGQTVFWKGGSKDPNNTTEWWWKDGAVPDKNEIINGISFSTTVDGEQILYFAADRYANNGDAIFGFWFSADQIGPLDNNRFSGARTEDKDLFLVMEYPQGSNANPTVFVYQWDTDSPNNLNLLYSNAAAQCDGTNQPACARTNDSTLSVPAGWDYVNKNGLVEYPPESVFEGKINVTQVAGEALCFASFLVETRSSTSVTAQLKDFIAGSLPVCSIDTTKTCEVLQLAPDNDKTFEATYTINLINDGGATLPVGTSVDWTDNRLGEDPNPNESGTVVLEAPLAAGEVIQLVTNTFYTDQNGPTNVATVSTFFGSTEVTGDSGNVECTPINLTPMIDLTKDCTTVLDDVGEAVQLGVEFDGRVCNLGDVPVDLAMTDVDANGDTGTLTPAYSTLDNSSVLDCSADVDCDSAQDAGDGECVLYDANDENSLGACVNLKAGNVSNPVCTGYDGYTVPADYTILSDNVTYGDTVTAVATQLDTIPDPGEEDSATEVVSASCPLCPPTAKTGQ